MSELRSVVGEANYVVSENGDVFRVGSSIALRPGLNGNGGYKILNLYTNGKGRMRYVHVIVATAFHGPRPSRDHEAAHADGNKANNHRDNISWKTRAENAADKVIHGTTNRGDRNGMSKISESQADEIRRRFSGGELRATIAKDFGITKYGVSYIARRRRRATAKA